MARHHSSLPKQHWRAPRRERWQPRRHPPPKFHLFSKLLVELRLKIWKIANNSRMVHLKLQHEYGKLYWTAKASCPLNILSANREARLEGLRGYDQPFHKGFLIPLQACKGDRSFEDLHFHWIDDLVYLDIPKNLQNLYRYWQPTRTFEKLFNSLFTRKAVSEGRIRKFAINDSTLTWFYTEPKSRAPAKRTKWEAKIFDQVQELVLVATKKYRNRPYMPIIRKDDNTGSEWNEKIEEQFSAITERRPEWRGPIITVASRRHPLPSKRMSRRVHVEEFAHKKA
jgi:hypothetical protein